MYKIIVIPILTHASVLSTEVERSLVLFESRILRWIFGAVQDKGMEEEI
jgi:hypothetical protein